MHPWITGRIVETMQHEARARAVRERGLPSAPPEPRRARVGLAIARLGYRIAGGGRAGTDLLPPAWASQPGRYATAATSIRSRGRAG